MLSAGEVGLEPDPDRGIDLVSRGGRGDDLAAFEKVDCLGDPCSQSVRAGVFFELG